MKVALTGTRPFDRTSFEAANAAFGHELHFFDESLTERSTSLVAGFPAICAFVNDQLNAKTLEALADQGVRLIALRSAGFNHVDLAAADARGLTVLRVPAYSPHAIAEHTAGLILTLNRKFHRAHARVRELNFELNGLIGFDLKQRTVGIVGTGRIGAAVAQIMNGFGCRILAFDLAPNDECKKLGVEYVSVDRLFRDSDIITLHCPLTPDTRHLINAATVSQMKRGVMLINTSRGAVLDTRAVIDALKSGQIGYLGLDVYEEEGDLFFKDLSDEVLQDDVFARLLSFPNVLITAHQAFLTHEALHSIAETTLQNLSDFERGHVREENRVSASQVVPVPS